jgi:hypothetical protein
MPLVNTFRNTNKKTLHSYANFSFNDFNNLQKTMTPMSELVFKYYCNKIGQCNEYRHLRALHLLGTPNALYWVMNGNNKGENKMWKEIKKYQGQSARQILKASELCQTAGGEWQWMYLGMIVMIDESEGYIGLSSIGGTIARLPLGVRGQSLAVKMASECEEKYVA